ncbi:MAG: hypothetical protein NWR47_05385 [Aestuariivirgaceae bacterium]|nr:hypothetical protein [Aestuariivirgaceae bacterium]
MLKMTENSSASAHAMGPLGLMLAASGATLLAFTMVGTATVAVIWAFVKLVGLPDVVLYGLLVAGIIPTMWVTVWTAGRAWHVEHRLQQGQDVDAPTFKMLHYFSKR